MTVVGNRIVLDDGKEISAPGLYDFRRFGDHIEFKLPFDSDRELHVIRNASGSIRRWTIWRLRGSCCYLDESCQQLTLPAGVYVSEQRITEVAQIATLFIIFYRQGIERSPIGCICADGSLLWRLPHLYFAMDPIKDSQDFVADDGAMTMRVSGLTGEIISQRLSY